VPSYLHAMIFGRLKNSLRMVTSPRARDYLHGEIACDVAKCTSLYGFGFAPDDWHYLASTMRQFLDDPEIAPEETFLWRYFHKFQPRDMFEALFDLGASDHPDLVALRRYRDPERGPMPWTPLSGLVEERLNAKFAGDYGPWSEDMIRRRIQRIATITNAIRREGYRHDKLADPDDCIRGVMVKHGNDWRMVIIGGNHRASALAALGRESIPVQQHRSMPAVIDVAAAAQWPVVREGVLEEGVARKIALHYFSVTGSAKAKTWGIV
jgi:hypothetical protein